ncbi:hypothetical protein BIW11_03511 [Tropilaelaps mercedesae]|uniref:Uncharacterized protein n=1 Tax=Tropilaelaps mercedesae TaxID=418985 RepID=A0A1V9XJX7_9ACAR|nr:hypothetical protein BIW11_03511 [Tropilaelaps mercedesae]
MSYLGRHRYTQVEEEQYDDVVFMAIGKMVQRCRDRRLLLSTHRSSKSVEDIALRQAYDIAEVVDAAGFYKLRHLNSSSSGGTNLYGGTRQTFQYTTALAVRSLPSGPADAVIVRLGKNVLNMLDFIDE